MGFLKSFQPKDPRAEKQTRNRKKADRRRRGEKGPKGGSGRKAELPRAEAQQRDP
jgi:hypothetical protein